MAERGCFLFKDSVDNAICIFLFCKMTEADIQKMLPDTNGGECDGDYYIAIYKKNGTNYLGRTFYEGIERLMRDEQMFDLTKGTFDDLPRDIEMGKSDFDALVNFTFLQISSFPKQYASDDALPPT